MNIQKLSGLSLLFLMAAGTITGARADVGGPGTQRVSLEVGGAFPSSVNNFSDDAKAGVVVGGQYLYNLDYFTAVGVQVDYYQFDGKDRAEASAGGPLNVRSQANTAAFEIMGRYTFLPKARFMPYVHTGLGFNIFNQTTDGEPGAGFTWADTGTTETRRLPDVSTVGISFSVGAGVETNLTDRLVLGLETVWRVLGVSKAAYGTTTINIPSLSLRLGWRFGQEPLPPGA